MSATPYTRSACEAWTAGLQSNKVDQKAIGSSRMAGSAHMCMVTRFVRVGKAGKSRWAHLAAQISRNLGKQGSSSNDLTHIHLLSAQTAIKQYTQHFTSLITQAYTSLSECMDPIEMLSPTIWARLLLVRFLCGSCPKSPNVHLSNWQNQQHWRPHIGSPVWFVTLVYCPFVS